MRTKKSSGLFAPATAIRLMTHAMMGAAMGLAFGLILTVINPVAAALVAHGGISAIIVFAATLVMTFAIGAALTGAVFMFTENDEP
jgi:hypothetical protein